MIIGVDIDGVISDIAGSLNKELEKLGHNNYDYSHWLTTVHECELSNSIFLNKLFWKNLKPFHDSWHQLNNWWGNGNDIYLVTARRSEYSISVLEDWLNSWNIFYNRFFICDMGDKISVLKSLKADFMIEDNPHEAMKIDSSGIRCILRRSWYNSDFWGEIESIGNLFDLEISGDKLVNNCPKGSN